MGNRPCGSDRPRIPPAGRRHERREPPAKERHDALRRPLAAEALQQEDVADRRARGLDAHRSREEAELGVDRFLGKPYQEDELLGSLKELLAPKQ